MTATLLIGHDPTRDNIPTPLRPFAPEPETWTLEAIAIVDKDFAYGPSKAIKVKRDDLPHSLAVSLTLGTEIVYEDDYAFIEASSSHMDGDGITIRLRPR